MVFRFLVIFSAIVVLFIGFWVMVRNKSTPNIILPKEGNIIFFGDSLVRGVGASQGNDLPSQLAKRIGLPIINAGRSGDTTGSALNRLESDVLSKNPRLVIILLGGNDALQQVPPQELYNNLSVMIDKIQQKGAAVLVSGVRGGLFGDPYRDKFERLAKEKRVSYIPNILEGILGRSELMSDPIHPNDKGYSVMADRIESVLREILQR